MTTAKMLQMGGLGLSKTLVSQEMVRFRDIWNMSQDMDGVLYTRNGDATYVDGLGHTLAQTQTGSYRVRKIAPYVGQSGESPLLFCSIDSLSSALGFPSYSYGYNVNEMFVWDLETNRRVARQSAVGILLADSDVPYTEIDNAMYFLPTVGGYGCGLHKWDGFKWHRAGLPQAALNGSTTTGSEYVKAMYINVDFQGNEVQGDLNLYQYTPSTNTVTFNPTKAGGAVPNQQGSEQNTLEFGFDNIFCENTSTYSYSAGSKTITITGTPDNNLVPGHWLQFYLSDLVGTYWATVVAAAKTKGQYLPSLIGLQCKNVTATTAVFDIDPANSYVYADKNQWLLASDFASALSITWASVFSDVNFAIDTEYVSNTWIAVFSSATIDSGYVLRYFQPVAYLESSYTQAFNKTVAYLVRDRNPFRAFPSKESYPGVASTFLEDVTDDTVTRITFPQSCQFIASYNGLLVLADSAVVYFSSVSFGGSTEMSDGLSNFVPGISKDGTIVGIGATENFIFASRQKRNYSIVGNLGTNNFEVRAYREPQPGVTSWKNIISVQDNVIFSNKFGVFAANQSAQQPVSAEINGIFYQKSAQRLSNRGTNMGPISLFEVSYDYTRNWVSWVCTITGISEPILLILDLKSGEFFLWGQLTWTSFSFVNGAYYCSDATTAAPVLNKETTNTYTNAAGTAIQSYVVSSWLTLGEPSLEKQYTQVKAYLRNLSSPAVPLTLDAYLDWNEATAVGAVDWTTDPQFKLSQKKKLDSNKSLAISVAIAPASGKSVELEGIEIEYNPIQEGMKR